jgi:hypothetical protein
VIHGNRPRGEHAAEPAQIVNHGLQQPKLQHWPQELKVKRKVLAASIPPVRPELLIDRPVGRMKAFGHRAHRIGLQRLKPPQSVCTQSRQRRIHDHPAGDTV